MHLQRLMGLALLAFARPLGTDALVVLPTLPVSDAGVHSAGVTGASVPRYIRSNEAVDFADNGEQRAGLAEKVATFFSSSKITPERLQKWLDEGKSAEIVFGRMRLKKAGEWLLYRPQFTDWLKYVDDLSAKNPTKGTSVIPTLTTHYGDSPLYKMIQSAKTYTNTKDLALRLEKEQMKHWVTTARAPDDVFHLMTLDKVEENILKNSKFITWSKYVDDFNAKYPEKATSMVPALVKYYSDDVTLFRIAEKAMSVEGKKDIATKLEDQLVAFWLNAGKSPTEALKELGYGYTSTSLLASPLFKSWFKYANAYSAKFPQEKATAIETLTRRFDDARVASMIGTARTEDTTRSVATKLEAAQLGMWWNSGKSVDDVYKLLALGLIGDFTHNPLLNTWLLYIDMCLKENPGMATTILRKWETLFKDRPLNQALLVAMKFPSMEKAATAIQTQNIKRYAANNESPVRVFQWLNLDNVGDSLLADPVFTMWLKYTKDFNTKNPKQRESVFTAIRMNYNSWPIERMIAVAMENPSTVNIAKRIQTERSRRWLDEKDPPRYVFHFLDLNKAGETTLANPAFKLWTKYLNEFNRRYPEEKTTMIDGIRANYNDLNLVRILNAAKQDKNTIKLATDLENALVNKWVAEKEPLEGLTGRFRHLQIANNLIKRYAAKLEVLAEKTS